MSHPMQSLMIAQTLRWAYTVSDNNSSTADSLHAQHQHIFRKLQDSQNEIGVWRDLHFYESAWQYIFCK